MHLEQSDTAFFCSVYDNGGGVDAKELPHLFDRFYRAHSPETKGAGMQAAQEEQTTPIVLYTLAAGCIILLITCIVLQMDRAV